MDGDGWEGGLDSHAVDVMVEDEDAGAVGEEGFEEGCDEEADAGEVSGEAEEEDDEAGEAFGGDSEGGSEEQRGGDAVAGGADEGSVAIVGGELLWGAELGDDCGGGLAGEFHGVLDVGVDFAEDLFALGESDGAEVGAEGGEKLLDLLLIGCGCGVHWRTSSG